MYRLRQSERMYQPICVVRPEEDAGDEGIVEDEEPIQTTIHPMVVEGHLVVGKSILQCSLLNVGD